MDQTDFDRFIKQFPSAPFYEVSEDHYKIPAGWLIEQAGLKGYRDGDAGVHHQQALVLVNHGHATGQDIWTLAQYVQNSVMAKYGIALKPEVNRY